MTTREQDHVWRAGALYLAITMVMAFPLSTHPHSHLLTYDSDAKLYRWILGWDVHAFLTQPLHLFDANIFAPLPNTLAYAEHMLGNAVLAAPVIWLTDNYILAMNVVALLTIPLSGMGAYLLARRLGVSQGGAVLAGLVLAFAPPRLFRLGQLPLTAIQWLPFCLAWLHTYLDRGRARDLRLALLMFSLQALSGAHGAVFLAVTIVALLLWRFALGDPLRIMGRVKNMGVPGALALLPAVLVFLPYLRARADAGLARTLAGWRTPAANFLASPSHLHQWIAQVFPPWLREAPDAYLFPGYLPLLLPVAGLLMAMAARTRRAGPATLRETLRQNSAVFYTLVAMGCVWLMLGPPYGVWQWVYDWPVLNFIRVPTRFALVLMLALGILTGMSFDRFTSAYTPRVRHGLAALLGLMLLVEFAAFPLAVQDYRHELPAIDRWLDSQPKPFTVAEAPMPRDPENYDLQNARNALYMVHSMAHWQKTVHGFSGVLPAGHQRLYETMARFPSEDAVPQLRALGVTYVVYHADMTDAAVASAVDAQFAPFTSALAAVHTEADGRVYRLR